MNSSPPMFLEKPIDFNSGSQKLFGIVHEPLRTENGDIPVTATGIIFFHGWGSYRIGPHRLLVQAAREFCKAGYICLRFDFRGRGESFVSQGEIFLYHLIEDARAAIKWLTTAYPVENIVLIGLCSGGEVALAASVFSKKIKKVICWSTAFTINKNIYELKQKETLKNLNIYFRKLFLLRTWKKIISGKININFIINSILLKKDTEKKKTFSASELQNKLIEEVKNFSGEITFIYGGGDKDGLNSLEQYRKFCKKFDIKSSYYIIDKANHNFYSLKWKNKLINITNGELIS